MGVSWRLADLACVQTVHMTLVGVVALWWSVAGMFDLVIDLPCGATPHLPTDCAQPSPPHTANVPQVKSLQGDNIAGKRTISFLRNQEE